MTFKRSGESSNFSVGMIIGYWHDHHQLASSIITESENNKHCSVFASSSCSDYKNVLTKQRCNLKLFNFCLTLASLLFKS